MGGSKNSYNFKVVMSGSDGCHHGNGKYLLVVIVIGCCGLFPTCVMEGMSNFS